MMGGMIAHARYYQAVRQFATTAPVWTDLITYFTLPDERWDLMLASRRIYGTPNEWLAVTAAAGLDRLDQEMAERELRLPTVERLEAIKRLTGYRSAPPQTVR